MTQEGGSPSGIPSIACSVCVGMPITGLLLPKLESFRSKLLAASRQQLGHTFRGLANQLIHHILEITGPSPGGDLAIGAGPFLHDPERVLRFPA